MSQTRLIHGIVRGKTIELDSETEFPDGASVNVTLHDPARAGEGFRKSFGAWSDCAEELDQYMVEVRAARKVDRPGVEE